MNRNTASIIVMIMAFLFVWFAQASYGEEATIRTVTAYNVGDERQCDSDPCIDAANTNICEALDRGEKRCAANFVPKWTRLHIEKVGVCVVTDRTNRRYKNRVDIAMKKDEYKKAIEFGRQNLMVTILDGNNDVLED